jgi:hypothetical protein
MALNLGPHHTARSHQPPRVRQRRRLRRGRLLLLPQGLLGVAEVAALLLLLLQLLVVQLS